MNKKLEGLKPMTEGIEFICKEDYVARHNKARELMNRQGIGAMLLSGSTNMRYFCGAQMGGSDRLVALLLPAEGEPLFICPEFELKLALEMLEYGQDNVMTWQEHEDPFKMTADYLKSRGLEKKKLAFDGDLRYWYSGRIWGEISDLHACCADSVTIPLRQIKSDKEIALMRRSAEISLKAHKLALDSLEEGMSEERLNSIYAEAHRRMGATDPWGGGSFGLASSFVHGTTQKFSLEKGMVILCDAGASFGGYCSDVSRTTVFGSPSARVLKALETGIKAQRAGINAVKPGVACQEVDRAIRRVLEENGYGPGYHNLPHRVGHGLGLDVHEHPYLVEGCDTPMQPGMTFAFDGAMYVDGEFGIRFEDDIVVTEDGCEVFGDSLAVSLERLFG